MAGTVHSKAYQDVLHSLVTLRAEAGLSQADLAAKLRKPPSFVGKYELGERRLDIIELLIILRELETDFATFWTVSGAQLPKTL